MMHALWLVLLVSRINCMEFVTGRVTVGKHLLINAVVFMRRIFSEPTVDVGGIHV